MLTVDFNCGFLRRRLNYQYQLRQNTGTVSGSSGSLPMSGRNGSASDADCRISEDCRVPDVELMELGPLLEEGGGRQAAAKSVHSEVGRSPEMTGEQKQKARNSQHYFAFFSGSSDAGG